MSSAAEVIGELGRIVVDIHQMQDHTGRKAQLTGSCIEEQSAKIGQLTEAAKDQHGMTSETIRNQNVSVGGVKNASIVDSDIGSQAAEIIGGCSWRGRSAKEAQCPQLQNTFQRYGRGLCD